MSCKHRRYKDDPRGYSDWHEWAEKKGKTHVQKQCKKCGLWVIWAKKVKL